MSTTPSFVSALFDRLRAEVCSRDDFGVVKTPGVTPDGPARLAALDVLRREYDAGSHDPELITSYLSNLMGPRTLVDAARRAVAECNGSVYDGNCHARAEVALYFEAWHPRHGEVTERDRETGESTRPAEAVQCRLADAGVEQWAEPEELLCPITLELFVEPVVASDGHTYERSALAALFAGGGRKRKACSPLTRAPLDPKVQVPNLALRKRLRSHVATTLAIAEAAVEKKEGKGSRSHGKVLEEVAGIECTDTERASKDGR
jgi:hypothetical protein